MEQAVSCEGRDRSADRIGGPIAARSSPWRQRNGGEGDACHHPRRVAGRIAQGARRVRGSVEALGDQSSQSGAPGCSSRDPGTCPWLGGRNAGAPAHHNGPTVGQSADNTAHVLSGRDRFRGDRVERRCGSSARLVAQPAGHPTCSRRDRHRQTGRHGQASVGATTRAAVGRDHRHLRRLRPLPRTDNATDTGRVSHTRKLADRTSSPERAADIGAQP